MNTLYSRSTGTVCSKKGLTGLMAQLVSLSAPLRRAILFCTSSAYLTRREHSGTTHIIVRQLTVNIQASANLRKIATQYCDGLRGALVIYDPLDPNRLL